MSSVDIKRVCVLRLPNRKITLLAVAASCLWQPASFAVPAAEPVNELNSAQTVTADSPLIQHKLSPTGEGINLRGIISVYDGPSPDQLVGGLVNAALQRDEDHDAVLKKDKQMHSLFQKTLTSAKMSAQYITEYRGFELSSEAADVLLDEKLRLKSRNATEYAKQKKVDEVHAKVFSSLLQIAQGLGTSDPTMREKNIASGLSPLSDLVGSENANAALKTMRSWSEQVNVPQSIFRQNPWTVMELQKNSDEVLRSAAQADPVMGLVRRALHKYNGHSKLSLGAAKLINSTLCVAMFTPTIVSPVAQIMLFVYQMSTGGPEDMKLLSELYLDKRMESRWKRLNQECGQAVNAYNNAIMTKNPVLLGLSETFISALGGEETSAHIVGSHRLVARKSTHDDSIDCVQTHGLDM